MARSIVITSGKGGVGKSTVAAALGRQLCRGGQRVVLIDTDIGLNNLDVMLDMENRVVYDIADVASNRCRCSQALIADIDVPGLYLLPSAHFVDDGIVTAQSIRAIVNTLSQSFDFILIDCPAGIDMGFHRAVAAAREAIVVTTPHISAVRDASKVIAIIDNYGLNSGVIVNRCRGDLVVESEMADGASIAGALSVKLLGVIPEDDIINLQSNAVVNADRRSEGRRAMEILANNILNGTSDVYDVTKRFRGVFGAVKRSLRKFV